MSNEDLMSFINYKEKEKEEGTSPLTDSQIMFSSTETPADEDAVRAANEALAALDQIPKAPQRDVEQERTIESLSDTKWTLDNARAIARSMLEGFTFELSPYIGLAAAAAAAKATPGVTEDYSTIYRKMRKDYDEQQAAAEEEIGGAMLGAELAGGLLAPIPGGASAKVGTTVGLGGVSGAAGITGEDVTLEERLGGAALGAGTTLGVMGVTSGLGKVIDFMSKRNIQTDLLKPDGSFTPIFLAPQEEGFTGGVQKFYRNILGNAPFSGSVLREQQKKFVSPIQEAAEKAKTESEQLVAAQKQILAESDAASKEARDQAVSALKADIENVTDIGKTKVGLSEDQYKALMGTGPSSEFATRTADIVKTSNDVLEHNFRKLAFFEAFPFYGDKTALKAIEQKLVSDPRDAMADLDFQWREKGFKPFFDEIPAGTALERKQVLKDMQASLSADEGLLQASRNASFKSALTKINEGFFYTAPARIVGKRVKLKEDKFIDPTKLGAAYAQLGRNAAMASDPNVKRGFYAVQNVLLDILENNVPKQTLVNFQKEKQKWKTLLAIRNSAENTGLKPGVQGRWSVNDYLKSVETLGKTNKRYGTGPLVPEAEKALKSLNENERTITAYMRSSFANRAKIIKDKVDAEKRATEALLNAKKAELEKAKKLMPHLPEYAQKAAEAQTAVTAAQQKLQFINSSLDEYKSLKISDMPSWQQETTTFNLLRNILPGLASGVAGAGAFAAPLAALGSTVAAAGALRGAASPTMQRFAAGQTAPQMAAQRAMQSSGGQLVNKVLTKNLPVVSAGMLTEALYQ
jgi:hypothetical protein